MWGEARLTGRGRVVRMPGVEAEENPYHRGSKPLLLTRSGLHINADSHMGDLHLCRTEIKCRGNRGYRQIKQTDNSTKTTRDGIDRHRALDDLDRG